MVVGVALVSAALLNTLKPIAFREEVSTFAISSSELDALGIPAEIGATVTLDYQIKGISYSKNFVLCFRTVSRCWLIPCKLQSSVYTGTAILDYTDIGSYQ